MTERAPDTAKRPRKLIVHAGMHKTGSTAIQHWLYGANLEDVRYFRWRNANHSDLFVLLFEENPHTYFALSGVGYTRDGAMRERKTEKENIRRQVEESDGEVFIFSAERISTAPEEAVEAMRDFFAQYFSDIEVYAYVREPAGFMTSMFQQHLKTGSIKFGYGRLWPGYRRRLKRFYTIFGEDKVHLRAFDALKERGTDAVGDFAAWIGVSTTPPKNIIRNRSMSAAGVALLFFYRKFIEPDVPEEKRAQRNQKVLSVVQKIPGERFHLDLTPNAKLRERTAKDLRWASRQTGYDLSSCPPPVKDVRLFRSEDEISEYAVQVSHMLLPERSLPVLDPDAAGREETIRRFETFLSHPTWVRTAIGRLQGRRPRR